jgi:hypothetical protein
MEHEPSLRLEAERRVQDLLEEGVIIELPDGNVAVPKGSTRAIVKGLYDLPDEEPPAEVLARIEALLEHLQPRGVIVQETLAVARGTVWVFARGALVALAVSGLGVASGLAPSDVHPLIAPIVAAESALLINILALYALRARREDDDVALAALDAAILAALRHGEYTAGEIRDRVHPAIRVAEVRQRLRSLEAEGKVKRRRQPGLAAHVWCPSKRPRRRPT